MNLALGCYYPRLHVNYGWEHNSCWNVTIEPIPSEMAKACYLKPIPPLLDRTSPGDEPHVLLHLSGASLCQRGWDGPMLWGIDRKPSLLERGPSKAAGKWRGFGPRRVCDEINKRSLSQQGLLDCHGCKRRCAHVHACYHTGSLVGLLDTQTCCWKEERHPPLVLFQ